MGEANFDKQLLKMSENFHLDNSINEEIFDNLEIFYSENNRHEYHRISTLVYNQQDQDNEILEFNLTFILELAKSKQSQYIKNYKKLFDHLRLSVTQKKFIEDHISSMRIEHQNIISGIQTSISEASASISTVESQTINLEKRSKEVEQRSKEIEDRSKKMTTEFVSILGIFSSVIFAAFGGLEILKNILGNIEKVHTGKLLVFSSLTIGAIVFLVFMLLNGISKLTDLKLRSCKCATNQNCNCNLVQKHPSIVIVYIVILFVLLTGISAYFLDYKVILNDITKTLESWVKLASVLIASIIFFIISIFWFHKKKNENTGS